MSFKLKDYQETCLSTIREFFSRIVEYKTAEQPYPVVTAFRDMKGGHKTYNPFISSKGDNVPFVCIQIPTGGGKTYLAAKAIDIAKEMLTHRKTGLVLWVTPTTAIYEQTLECLNIKSHPYRIALDIASGGRTKIVTRDERFTPSDIEENLLILVVTIQAISREKDKQLLFHKPAEFTAFFPDEDDFEENERVLKNYPALRTYFEAEPRLIIPSLGNTVARLEPIIIVDEGHRFRTKLRYENLQQFNPRAIIEFTATPPKGSNILYSVGGRTLHAEEMIKLPLNLTNMKELHWEDTLLASKNKLDELQHKAIEYENNGNPYIRPICLIQVENVGEAQLEKNTIHAERAKAFLISKGVKPEEIAFQTNEAQELPKAGDEIGLLSERCPIRYVITKYALKEGWDCPFAYVLCLLNTPSGETNITQLFGRILRQYLGKRTGVPELDQCYVYSYRHKDIYKQIVDGFEKEGFSDITSQINTFDERSTKETVMRLPYTVREKYRNSAKHFFLPTFVYCGSKNPRLVDYDADIVSRLEWDKLDISTLAGGYSFSEEKLKNESISVTYTDADVLDKIDAHGETINTHQPATPQYLAREIHDIVTNPWVAYDLSEALLKRLVELSSEETVQHNLYKVTNWFRTQLYQVREDLSYNIFDKLLKSEEIRFVFFKDSWHPSENKFAPSTGKRLTTDMGDKMQHSLFEAESVLEGEFNTYEKQVAFLLDGHLKLYFWHRNHSNKNVDYFLQGWRQHRIFPDFLATQKDPSNDDSYDKVFIIETKGDHLQESKDINIHDRTGYIKKLFEQCNTVKPTHLTELGLEMKGKQVRFEVVYQSEFPSKLEALFR